MDAAFGFTGFYRHGPSGLDLTLYRAYDPDLGRWISRDPIGEHGGLNLYGYVYSDTIRHLDRYGLQSSVESPEGVEVMEFAAQQAAATAPAATTTAMTATVTTTIVVNSAVGVALFPSGSKPQDVLNPDQLAEYRAERKAYSARCKQQPPPGLSKCEELKWRIEQQRDCARMRSNFGRK